MMAIIPRMAIEDYPRRADQDIDVVAAYNWFKSYISEKGWTVRKDKIEKHLSSFMRNGEPFSEPISEGTLLVVEQDQIGWYLYLVHTYLYEYHKYEFFQGARVVPIFKRIGKDLALAKNIKGIDKKMRDLLKKRTSEADSILFEILTALLWGRNGWEVTMLEEGFKKTPDLLVEKGDQSWEVECKRQKKTSDYAYRETKKRQIMVSHLSKTLLSRNMRLEIDFHVELETLSDAYLRDQLEGKLRFVVHPGKLVSNNLMDVSVSFVDVGAIREFASSYFLKTDSPKLLELIAGKEIEHTGFTSGLLASHYYVGDGQAGNLYISDVKNAFGVQCTCNAPEAIFAKARDVKNLIKDAIDQFSSGARGIVHIGMETHDGPQVEKKRMDKILKSMTEIDPRDTSLRWIFYHYFQSYSRSYNEWYFDETVTRATPLVNPVRPLKQEFLVIEDDHAVIEDAVHWQRDLP